MVSLYEREREPEREKLETFVAAMGYGPEVIDFLHLGLAWATEPLPSLTSPLEPEEPEKRRIRLVAIQAGVTAAEATAARLYHFDRVRRAAHARSQAAGLWDRLAACSSVQRRLLVEKAREFQTWALAERLCSESEAAVSEGSTGVDLAELALRAAERSPGGACWHASLVGYTLAFLANAQRAQGNLLAAEEILLRAWERWKEGQPDHGAELAAWRLPYFEGILRRDQQRLDEAIECLDRALALETRNGGVRILLARASVLKQKGEIEQTAETLRLAFPKLQAEEEPRLAFALYFNLAAISCQLGRHGEAALLFPRVREIGAALNSEHSRALIRHLRGAAKSGMAQSPRRASASFPWCEG